MTLQHTHLIGIGGAGMSAIARVLLQQGHTVSGSDRAANAGTAALERDGARVFIGHDATNIAGATQVITTSAAQADNPEIVAAKAAGIPVFKRSEIIADLMTGKQVIAVAGTHGKTTTSAMTTHILRETRRNPSYIVGGVLANTGDNAAWNEAGRSFVIEADEYDHMFLGIKPDVAVITNIEWDHPDFFPAEADLVRAFEQFAALLPQDGTLIACGESPLADGIAAQVGERTHVLRYGGRQENDARLAEVQVTQDGTTFIAHLADSAPATVRLLLPGVHNALNALAAMCAAYTAEGVSPHESARALATFRGTGRRFEVRADAGGIAVVDDYAHHPTAIRATAAAARARYPDRALWIVWQPHTFSRTRALWNDYADALREMTDKGAQVLVTDIYAARELPDGETTAARLVNELGLHRVRHTATLTDAADLLVREVESPAAILIMSAGDAPQIGVDFLQKRGLMPDAT